ncbi:hypothetical protein BX600DRAFT_231886 [Xylariales sp. PMI_506]|nr:hypothetical protein BX600DRAFT_231886 [Xylariales sp. PMI_506]
MLAGWVSASVIFSLFQIAILAPVNYFPVNSQLPPVARVSQPFSFVFSSHTFSSPYPISYSLLNAPAWLSIDSDARRLYGTPRDQDALAGTVVGVPFQLVAEDQSGTSDANVTLVISRNPPPDVAIPLSDQIQNFGAHSTPSSILVYPSKDFSFSFDKNTFGKDAQLNYYAVSGDNVPLPSWIQFDAGNLTFSGQGPVDGSQDAPAQSYTFQLVASDVIGFASVSIPFSIVVGEHELSVDTSLIELNATRGTPFEFDDLSGVLKFDNQPINNTNETSVAASGVPDWLTFDPTTWRFSGTPGSAANSSNVTVVIHDEFEDSVNVTVAILITSDTFRSPFPALDVAGGETVSFDLKPYLWNPSDVQLELNSDTSTSWLRLDSSSLILTGTAPATATSSTIQISITAKSKTTQQTESQDLPLRMSPGGIVSSTESTSTTTSTSAPVSTTSAATDVKTADGSNKLLLWILLPLVLMCVVLVWLFIYLRKRRRDPKKESILQVSAPLPGSFVRYDMGKFEQDGMRGMYDIGATSPRKAPQAGSRPVPPRPPFPKEPTSSSEFSHSSILEPHALRNVEPFSVSNTEGTGEQWVATQAGRVLRSNQQPKGGESLLSDTTYDGSSRQMAVISPTWFGSKSGSKLLAKANGGLTVPTGSDARSIQTTPDFAYTDGKHSPEDSVNSQLPSIPRPVHPRPPSRLESHGNGDSILRTASRRVSNAWKRGSASKLFDEYKYKYAPSTSTVQSSLTTPSEHPTMANVVSHPTVIHIPSQPGEKRQISRRVDGTSPLFGGRSTLKSPKRFGVKTDSSPDLSRFSGELPPPRPFAELASMSRDSDTSWDKFARDSLGIAHKDLVNSAAGGMVQPSAAPAVQKGAKRPERKANGPIKSADLWIESSLESVDEPAASRGPALRLFPSSAKLAGLKKSRDKRRSSKGGQGITSQTKKSHLQALDDFKAKIAEPDDEWPLPEPRSLPEAPKRDPLSDRLNESSKGKSWRKSNKSTKSIRSVKSVKNLNGQTDDEWEDIRPGSMPGEEFFADSAGSFPVYI